MSHTVTIKTRVQSTEAVGAACRRLAWPAPTQGQARLYADTATGLIVQPPGWRYPVVIDTQRGELRYDTFGGTWGDERELHRFLQAYAVECTRLEARRKGHAVSEQSLADGSIRLSVQTDS